MAATGLTRARSSDWAPRNLAAGSDGLTAPRYTRAFLTCSEMGLPDCWAMVSRFSS